MHSKQKGNIGMSMAVLLLQKNEFNVFSEIGDYSKIDLIAEKNGKLIKIQVKYSSVKNECVIVPIKKSGPNGYRYTYKPEDVDWFAVYNPITDDIYWVKSSEACKYSTYMYIRIKETTKNNQTKGIHFSKNYSINNFIKEYNMGT